MALNLNFLNEDSKNEFLRLYGENASENNVSTYAHRKSEMNFDKIDDIVFDVIDAVFNCKWHNFNLDLIGVDGFERDEKRRYYLTFWFEDIDFACSSDGKSTTTEYGIEVMNNNFAFKDKCIIRKGGYDFLQLTITTNKKGMIL